jgi:hypothetical protein
MWRPKRSIQKVRRVPESVARPEREKCILEDRCDTAGPCSPGSRDRNMGPHEMAVADIHGSEVRRTSPTEARQMLHLPSHQFVPRERVMAPSAWWISKRAVAPNAISRHDFPLSKFSPSDSPSSYIPFFTRSPQHSQNSLRKYARYRSAADGGERNWEEESHHADEED